MSINDIVPKKLARRVSGSVDYSVKFITTHFLDKDRLRFQDKPFTKIDYRVFYFNIIDDEDELF